MSDTKMPQMQRAVSSPTNADQSGCLVKKQSIYLEDWRKQHTKKDFDGIVVLYYCPEMKSVAIDIALESKGRVLLGDISWKHFPDHFPNLHVNGAADLKYVDVAYLASLHSPEALFEQMAIIHTIPRYGCKSVKVIVPYFATGTMERVDRIGDIATAATLARMLSMTPMCAGGPAQLAFFDIHTLQNQFYFTDNVLVRLRSCVPLLLRELAKMQKKDGKTKIAIAFPDEGAKKRFGKKFTVKGFSLIICQKVRIGDKRVVTIKEGEIKDRHVVIVDDLVQSGGTMIQCAKALHAGGAAKVSGYCTHSIFPNESWKKFLHDEKAGTKGHGNFDSFLITNSHPTSKLLVNKPPFKVISMAPLVSDYILDGYGLDNSC